MLGGQQLPPKRLRAWSESASLIIAADSGADALLKVGVTPNIVVGDLDSLRASRDVFPDVRHDPDQESTDCDKALSLAASLGAKSVTVLAAEGDLPDHAISNLHSFAKSSLDVRIIYRRGVGMILRGDSTVIARARKRVSVAPITDCEVSISGVRWPLTRERLSPTSRNSVSNEATGDHVTVQVHTGVALLFIATPPDPWWQG